MKKHIQGLKFAGLGTAFLGIVFCSACQQPSAAQLSAESVAARVVDADTGQPLVGVAIMAYWELHQGSFTGHALPCGAVDIEEAVTDEKGDFRIPGWGPVTLSSSCDMRDENPSLILFKSGYSERGLNNNPMNPLKTVSVSQSIWNGQTIKMREFPDMDLSKNDIHSYAFEFQGLSAILERFALGGCTWKKMPNMLRAVYLQQLQFDAAGHNLETVITKLFRDDQEMQKEAPQCGSPKAFIEGLVKTDPQQTVNPAAQ